MICIIQWYLRFSRRWEYKGDAREITIQREQYGATVHLFIGTGRSPDRITFMSLMFTLNHNASYQGLSSLFPFRSVSSSTFVIILSRSSFSHSLGVRSFCLRVVSPYHAYLHPKAEPPATVYVTLKNILVTFFRTFGRGRPQHIVNLTLNLSYNLIIYFSQVTHGPN